MRMAYRVFSHEITAAIMVSQTMKRRPWWCPTPILWDLNSFHMQSLSFEICIVTGHVSENALFIPQ